MKTKITVIIGCILMVLGFGLSFTALAAGNFDINNLVEDIEYETKTVTFEPKEKIYIDASVTDFYIKPAMDNMIKIEYAETKYEKASFTYDESKLSIIQKTENRNWFILTYPFWKDVYMTIYIPESVKVMEIDSSVSDIDIRNVTLDKLLIDESTGDIEVYDSTIKEVNIDSNTGDVEFLRVNGEKVDIDLSTGEINMDYIDFSISIILATSTGDIELGASGIKDNYLITAKTSTGDKNIKNTQTGTIIMNLTSRTGDIDVTFIN